MSSLIEPSQFAMLFTSAAFLESVGKIINSPFMAFLLRMGRDYDGRVTGLPFFLAGSEVKEDKGCFLQQFAANAVM
ncbi:hypothetical protein CFAM422_006118 [Trichoderma lentiforme]|uniref:Uncharacterized protein n=1 Tax=Trichoderma lentiforme TaxID=1567552 RepID=A0A9P4XFM6_9HYPO|nr:hypothetical protein CFAM422_006118 [Trichoderma lentiforme]